MVRGKSIITTQWSLLAVVCPAALVLPLSFSGGAVATPAIGQALGGNAAALTWITNAFMLSFGSTLMAAGTLADRFGRKRVFAVGIGLFSAVSLLLGLAPSILVLDLLRALQGLAAAAALAGGSAALAQVFEGHARTRAFSVLGTTFGVGLAFGPLLAGWLIEQAGWRWVFLSSALIGGSVVLLGLPCMQESRDPAATRLDWPGTVTFTGALGLFTAALIQGPADGWSSPRVLVLLLGAAAALLAFIIIEQRSARPMLDLALFRHARFLGVQTLPLATCYCYVVLLVVLPLRFIGIEQRSAFDAGVQLLVLSAPMLIVPSLAARLTRRYSAGLLCSVGLLIAAVGLFLLSRIEPGHTATTTALPLLLIGCGTGLPWGLMDGLAVSVVPKERAGMAMGIFSTTRVAGESIALASVSALLATLIQSQLATLTPQTADQLGAAAQRLATGDLSSAARLLPQLSRATLEQSYTTGFQLLSYALITVTLAATGTVFILLRRRSTTA